MFLAIRDLAELRLLTAALMAERDGPDLTSDDPDEVLAAETMDPLVDRMLAAAEATGFESEVGISLDESERDRLLSALEGQLDHAVTAGELFLVGDLEAILRKLGQGT